MDALEWKASMDRIESTLFEIINVLKMESQRWATSPIFSTPSPVSIIAPPTSVPVPSPPPTTHSSMTPKQASVTNQPPKKNFRHHTSNNHCSIPTPLASKPIPASPRKATTTKSSSKPKPTPSLIQASMVSSGLSKVVYTRTTTNQVTQINGATPNRDWRPPWGFIKTAPNAAGRTEWRPPWCTANDLA
ncbi:hypothetical protein HanRHA438_Chr04g0194971 [Helianthus annuus]|nr:hypothetical protein HanIR_Chr05g0248141 [Helianthus annuus]KAJ0928516.1 hypothetical protein HanRHA438_Chr04g0194971 [Helianthus annuus]